MPEMTRPRELFLHELRDIYYVEKQLVTMLPKLAGEATDAELERGFQQHKRQTERHVKNIETAFRELGVRRRVRTARASTVSRKSTTSS
jgi:ferritin-like metal-binding protein YciE